MPVFTSGGGSSAPKVEQATPSISVSSSGLITATSNQQEGLVPSGTKTATYQLTTQSGTTITPGTSQKTACASGRYATGNILVAGDSDLKASNIKSGVNIFGVTGSLEGKEAATGTFNLTSYEGSITLYYFSTDGHKSTTLTSGKIVDDILKGSLIIVLQATVYPMNIRTTGDVEIVEGIYGKTMMGSAQGLAYIYSVTGDFTMSTSFG